MNAIGLIFSNIHDYVIPELSRRRAIASIPFGGRYRLIDFSLSAMKNCGIRDVSVIMQKDYQSLMDHIGSGKDWDMSKKNGGLSLLPPFGMGGNKGAYGGLLEALLAAEPYLRRMKENNIVIMPGNLAINIDLKAVLKAHVESGAGVTVVCAEGLDSGEYHKYTTDEQGFVVDALYQRAGSTVAGVADLEVFIVKKDVLLEMLDFAAAHMRYAFHDAGINEYLKRGGKVKVYLHDGYAVQIKSVEGYLKANMDMLCKDNRKSLFPVERPILTNGRADVSTYYSEESVVVNSLVSDGCFIEGTVKNSILSPGVHVGKGSVLENCIIMRDAYIGDGVTLKNVISDKFVRVEAAKELIGSDNIPVVIPRGYTT